MKVHVLWYRSGVWWVNFLVKTWEKSLHFQKPIHGSRVDSPIKAVRQPVQINQFGRTDGHHRKPKSSEMSQLAELKLFDQFGSTKFSDFPQVRKCSVSPNRSNTFSLSNWLMFKHLDFLWCPSVRSKWFADLV